MREEVKDDIPDSTGGQQDHQDTNSRTLGGSRSKERFFSRMSLKPFKIIICNGVNQGVAAPSQSTGLIQNSNSQ